MNCERSIAGAGDSENIDKIVTGGNPLPKVVNRPGNGGLNEGS